MSTMCYDVTDVSMVHIACAVGSCFCGYCVQPS